MSELYGRLTQAVWSELDGRRRHRAAAPRGAARPRQPDRRAAAPARIAASRVDTRSMVRVQARALLERIRVASQRPGLSDETQGAPRRQRRHAGAGAGGEAAAQRRLRSAPQTTTAARGRPLREALEAAGGRPSAHWTRCSTLPVSIGQRGRRPGACRSLSPSAASPGRRRRSRWPMTVTVGSVAAALSAACLVADQIGPERDACRRPSG